MTVPMTGVYAGQLKMELTHGPSGSVIRTAAPVDNRGDGSSFSPTDLLGAALGSCMVTTMAIVAEREGIPFPGASFTVEKHMRSDPRRVDRLPVRLEMPGGLTAEQRSKLEDTARGCPVMRSLEPAIEKAIEFVYPD